MATTIEVQEGAAAKPVYRDAAWGRIEAFIRVRWGSRSVVYIAEGPGEWKPPLEPTTIGTVEAWDGSAWVAATPDASPLGGYCLPSCGPYRFTGTVGHNRDGAAGSVVQPPSAVIEAHDRLSRYFRAIQVESPVAASFGSVRRQANEDGQSAEPTAEQPQTALSMTMGVEEFSDRSPRWTARALELSGAADLLRPYRKLGAA